MREWYSRPSRLLPNISRTSLFLDVQMPKLTGFDVLELIEPQPAVTSLLLTTNSR